MPQLKLKDQKTKFVHVPGLGVFEQGKFTDVTDEQLEVFEAQERSVVNRKTEGDKVVAVHEVEKLKASDLFEVKASVEKKDTGAKKSDNGGDDK